MADIVSRIYSGFRGVDFRGEEVNLVRSPDALNMWKDYKETESIRTRPAFQGFYHTGVGFRVHGIWSYKGKLIVHFGSIIAVKDGESLMPVYHSANDAPSCGFVFEDIFYFKDGVNYLRYDGADVSAVEGYVPTTSIARRPMGGGTTYEDVNMLSDYRKNSFLASGTDYDFFLDVLDIDTDFAPEVTLNGEVVPPSDYKVFYDTGRIQFLTENPPEPPLTEGQDNIVVKFKKTRPGYKESILKCTMLQVFDNRVFFSGNPDHPNYVWHSSLNNPTYCSDLDYYREGMDQADVKGMVAGNNALWVFREPSDSNTTVFYHTPTIDEQYGKVYPSTHSSITTGCVGQAINFNDDIVFFSERGMEGISGDITTEQVVAHRSSLVDRKMIAEADYKNMVLVEWEGYLIVFIGEKAYLADSRATFQNENHIEYEWFYWDTGLNVRCATVIDGVLYVGTDNGYYTLTDTASAVPSHWTTPKDKFKHPHKLKTTNKRGCVAEATGDITVYAKLEDTDFEEIGEYTGVTDYFVSRIKRKKFKDIQLKFESTTRFSLETVTLEAFIGGYIKR